MRKVKIRWDELSDVLKQMNIMLPDDPRPWVKDERILNLTLVKPRTLEITLSQK